MRTKFTKRMMSAKKKEDTYWTVSPEAAQYVDGKYAGWTNDEATHARMHTKIGKRKSIGSVPKEQDKTILVTLVLDIPENSRFTWSPRGTTRKDIEAQWDTVDE